MQLRQKKQGHMARMSFVLWLFLFGCTTIKHQNNIIFKPAVLSKDYTFQLPESVKEVFIELPEGLRLNALVYQKPGQKNLLIYFQGNAKNLQNWLDNHRSAMDWETNVLVADYRGFGKSGGEMRGQKTMYKDAESIYDYAISLGYAPENIILYGYSMGTAPALHLAAIRPAKKLILESPYSSIKEIAWVGKKAPSYPFNNKEKARWVTVPALILHGTRDTVLTPDHAQRVFENLGAEKKELQLINGGGHGNLKAMPEVNSAIKKFIHSG